MVARPNTIFATFFGFWLLFFGFWLRTVTSLWPVYARLCVFAVVRLCVYGKQPNPGFDCCSENEMRVYSGEHSFSVGLIVSGTNGTN